MNEVHLVQVEGSIEGTRFFAPNLFSWLSFHDNVNMQGKFYSLLVGDKYFVDSQVIISTVLLAQSSLPS